MEACQAMEGFADKIGSPVTYFKRLTDNFGGRFVILLFCTYFGIKGALYTLVIKGDLPYYTVYMGLDGGEFQKLSTFAMTPWALKAAIGALSDTIPIFGYHKKYYIIGSTFLGALSFVLIASLAIGNESLYEHGKTTHDGCDVTSPTLTETLTESASTALSAISDIWGGPIAPLLPPFLMFLIHLQIATVDLIVEGRYAQMMVEKPHTGTTLVTWVWVSYFLGSIAVTIFVGPMADSYNPRYIFALGIPLSIQVLVPVMLGYLKEEKVPNGIKREKFSTNKPMYVLAFSMAFGALRCSIQSLFLSDLQCLYTYIETAAILSIIAYYTMPRQLALCNIYMFLCQALYLQVNGVLTMWFLTGDDCNPGGPHFSYTYFHTWSGIVGGVAALLGTVLFQIVFSGSTFRRAFWLTTVLKVVGSIFDVFIIKRWNISAGISDKSAYLFGDAVISTVASQLDFMPAVVLTSKLCPPGYEAMVYAVLGGFQNFGSLVSSTGGRVLASSVGLNARRCGPCDFDGLASVVTFCHMLLPLVSIPLTFYMIPNAKLTDDLLGHGKTNTDLTNAEDSLVELAEADVLSEDSKDV
eukprot:TRINITY_DN15185_c0_g1_i2.p1 TRINITY_DN15185_c0_g1~~TRINITY_DN15185_c0_g1_i2.p1  ORF type:complete len:581 (+),score=57.39 TRINITY_DN15185_c0_g1_i2:85-1827(+)